MVVVSKESALKNLTETIAKLTTERDKTISLMSQSWKHEPHGDELIYNHTVTLLDSIKRKDEAIANQAKEIKMLNLELMHLSDACDGISEHNTEAELDCMTLSLKVAKQAEWINELEKTTEGLYRALAREQDRSQSIPDLQRSLKRMIEACEELNYRLAKTNVEQGFYGDIDRAKKLLRKDGEL